MLPRPVFESIANLAILWKLVLEMAILSKKGFRMYCQIGNTLETTAVESIAILAILCFQKYCQIGNTFETTVFKSIAILAIRSKIQL